MTYNSEGKRTSLENLAGQVTTTAWDGWPVTYNGENRPILWTLINSSTPSLISMSFDRMGRRVEYIETINSVTNAHHRFVYDGYLCIQRLDGAANNAVDLAFGWDPTEPIATRPLWMQRVSGTYNFFYFHDGNKNVSDLVSYQSARGVPAHYEYAPFGAVTAATTNTAFTAFNVADTNPYRFSSEYADDALGLVYYNYRHYNPIDGRWTSRDPIGEFGAKNIYLCAFLLNGCDFLGLKIAWSSRDISKPWGNHHFVTFIYNCKMEAPLSVQDRLKEVKCSDGSCPVWVATLGLRQEHGKIGVYENDSDDYQAIKEQVCRETVWYKSDWDYQQHDIIGYDENDLASKLLEGYVNFKNNLKNHDLRYNLLDLNCATWVNGLMTYAGLTKEEREKLGEFWGFDWGEEDTGLDEYFKFNPAQ